MDKCDRDWGDSRAQPVAGIVELVCLCVVREGGVKFTASAPAMFFLAGQDGLYLAEVGSCPGI
jgi:hypothetical protein